MILIIENEPMEAWLMSMLLEQQQTLSDGTRITCQRVTSGLAAMTWLAQQPPSSVPVVLLDQSLGAGEDGLTLVPHLRRSPALRPDASVLIWSGHDEPEMVDRARVAGADAFISKQRVSKTLGQEVAQLVADLWVADAQGQARPWIILSRSGRSASPSYQHVTQRKVGMNQ